MHRCTAKQRGARFRSSSRRLTSKHTPAFGPGPETPRSRWACSSRCTRTPHGTCFSPCSFGETQQRALLPERQIFVFVVGRYDKQKFEWDRMIKTANDNGVEVIAIVNPANGPVRPAPPLTVGRLYSRPRVEGCVALLSTPFCHVARSLAASHLHGTCVSGWGPVARRTMVLLAVPIPPRVHAAPTDGFAARHEFSPLRRSATPFCRARERARLTRRVGGGTLADWARLGACVL